MVDVCILAKPLHQLVNRLPAVAVSIGYFNHGYEQLVHSVSLTLWETDFGSRRIMNFGWGRLLFRLEVHPFQI